MLSREPLNTFFEIEGGVAIGALGSSLLGWILFIFILGVLGGVASGIDAATEWVRARFT